LIDFSHDSRRQPNIEHGLKDQTSIALTLFNTILETVSTQAELERSWKVFEQDMSICECWEVFEQDISIRERWEARKR
jgi:hypothetical protein